MHNLYYLHLNCDFWVYMYEYIFKLKYQSRMVIQEKKYLRYWAAVHQLPYLPYYKIFSSSVLRDHNSDLENILQYSDKKTPTEN